MLEIVIERTNRYIEDMENSRKVFRKSGLGDGGVDCRAAGAYDTFERG